MKDGGTVINLTDYDIVNPDELAENGMVQSVEKKKILILKKVLQEIEGYEIVSIQDITEMVGYSDSRTLRKHFTEHFGVSPSKYMGPPTRFPFSS